MSELSYIQHALTGKDSIKSAASMRAVSNMESSDEQTLYQIAIESGPPLKRTKAIAALCNCGTALAMSLASKAAFIMAVELLLKTSPHKLLEEEGGLKRGGPHTPTPVDTFFATALDAAYNGATGCGSVQCAVMLGFMVEGLATQCWAKKLEELVALPDSHWHDPGKDVLAADPSPLQCDKVWHGHLQRSMHALQVLVGCSLLCSAAMHRALTPAGVSESINEQEGALSLAESFGLAVNTSICKGARQAVSRTNALC